jgi:hypothetical protein
MEAKMERVRQINARITIIDKIKCPLTFRNFEEAALDQKQRIAALVKEPNQHGLDGTLHMVHPKPWGMFYKKMPKNQPDGLTFKYL